MRLSNRITRTKQVDSVHTPGANATKKVVPSLSVDIRDIDAATAISRYPRHGWLLFESARAAGSQRCAT